MVSIIDGFVDHHITISSTFTVSAFKRTHKLNVRDLLGFSCLLERYSQLEAIVNRTRSEDYIDIDCELFGKFMKSTDNIVLEKHHALLIDQ